MYYALYTVFVMVWIIGIYMFFNRKKIIPEKLSLPPDSDIIATAGKESKIRIVFDQGDKNNLDIQSFADFTVKYSDMMAGRFPFPEPVENPVAPLTEKREEIAGQKTEKIENVDLSNYVNIFTIKT